MARTPSHRSRRFADSTAAIILARQTGADGILRCNCGCGRALTPDITELDHVVPWELSRDSSAGNGQALAWWCHALKTFAVDAPAIARARRLRKRHNGQLRRVRHPLPCGRDTRWKLRVGGRGPVPRTTLAERHAATMAKRGILTLQPEA